MTKSELVQRMIDVIKPRHVSLLDKDVEYSVNVLLDGMSCALSKGKRIEVRGFGSFVLNYRAPRIGRNPKTGEQVEVAGKHVPHFKPGKELRERVLADA